MKLQERAGLQPAPRSVLSVTLLLLVPGLFTASLALTQAPQSVPSAPTGGMRPAQNIPAENEAQDVNKGNVYINDEHKSITLLDKQGGNVLASASYWRIVWSPAARYPRIVEITFLSTLA